MPATVPAKVWPSASTTLTLVGVLDHVVIGEDETAGIDDDARPGALLDEALGPVDIVAGAVGGTLRDVDGHDRG